jgi:hypothetical protein
METWRKCGHQRTIENAVARKLKNGCRACCEQRVREYYYRGRGYSRPPLPLAYRNALEGPAGRFPQVAGKYVCKRVLTAVLAADPISRACYLMAEFHKRSTAEIARWLEISKAEVEHRCGELRDALSRTEHQNRYRDWPLVQQLIDEGVCEAEVKDMIGISKASWNEAKRRKVIHV